MVGIVMLDMNGQPQIEVPPMASVGVPFVLGITTWGTGACIEPESTDVMVDGLNADITPYDRELIQPCTLNITPVDHPVTLMFDSPGTATVRIHVRRASSHSDPDVPVELTYELLINAPIR